MSDIIVKPRGTLDYLGDEMKLYDSVQSELSKMAVSYGAIKAEPPIFEETRLFVRGVGESSDIVSKEMFGLNTKGEHDYVLRPEFTAGINRLSIENKLYASPDLPIKMFYCGPVFRFERPQKGRLREFNQFGVEFLDKKIDLLTSLDCLILYYRGGEKVLGRDLKLRINYLGSFQSRENYKKALKDFYAPHLSQMCPDCQRRYNENVLRILDCKVEEDKELNKDAPLITDYLLPEDKMQLEQVERALDELNIGYELDPMLVRGLDYYTGLVFELYDPMNMDLGALGGGGQYGNLMKEIGGPDFEGIGFSYGMERLLLALSLERKNKMLEEETTAMDFFLIDLRADKDNKPVILADELRSNGLKVASSSYGKALSGALKMADRLHSRYSLIFDDYNPGKVLIKNMNKRTQDEYGLEDIDKLANHLCGLI